MNRVLGPETAKCHKQRHDNGFYAKFMQGKGLDIGYKGSVSDAKPVLETAVGVDMDYPGYFGEVLPFGNESQDYVFTSHTLEHIKDPVAAIHEWFRVVKLSGHLILIVPHKYLYEKKFYLPSLWNGDHKRFYTPSSLMSEIESSLITNTWRLRHMIDNDSDFDYSVPPEKHSSGCYEIECVIQKIIRPAWNLK